MQITESKYGNCPSNFRIHKTSIMKEIGFGDKQMESKQFVDRAKKAGYKVGLFLKSSKLIVAHWKLENNGFPEGFTNYKTYGRHWWTRED